MRNLRQRIIGHLWATVTRTLNLGPRTFSVFPRGWEVPAGQLHRFNPRQKINAVRSLINRNGGCRADGYLIGFIHGEFEPTRQVYQLHLHLLATAGMRDVIDRYVRDSPTARSIRAEYGITDFVRQRVRKDPELTNLPSPLTYMLKSYWLSRWQGLTPKGNLRRAGKSKGQRLREPHHTEVLRWMDRWTISDLSLLMNLSVGRDGFVLADRAYTNGDI